MRKERRSRDGIGPVSHSYIADPRLSAPYYPKLLITMKATMKPIETRGAVAHGIDLKLGKVVFSVERL